MKYEKVGVMVYSGVQAMFTSVKENGFNRNNSLK